MGRGNFCHCRKRKCNGKYKNRHKRHKNNDGDYALVNDKSSQPCNIMHDQPTQSTQLHDSPNPSGWNFADNGMCPPAWYAQPSCWHTPSVPATIDSVCTPFSGDFSGAAWNSQALFARKSGRQKPKMTKARGIVAKHDFSIFEEVHGADGRIDALRLPPEFTAFWSNHPDVSSAGIGIILKSKFLALFNPIDKDKDWEVLEKGRAAVLHLRGPKGALDIFCVYLVTGTGNLAAARQKTIRKIVAKMHPRDQVLSIMAGDFNFVEHQRDRVTLATGNWSGSTDIIEAKTFQDNIAGLGLHEWDQPNYTCEAGGAMSRIDRFYCNQHISFQLDKQCSCSVLEWDKSISTHRAISFARRTPPPKDPSDKPISPHEVQSEGWKGRVIAHYNGLCEGDPEGDNPIRRLILLKDAMRVVTNCDREDKKDIIEENAPADSKLGYTMSCLRAYEDSRPKTVLRCCRAYSKLKDWINVKDLYKDKAFTIGKLRTHAVDLAREQIQDDIQSVNNTTFDSPEDKQKVKDNIMLKLKRLSPGESTTLNAMCDDSGKIHTSPEEIAAILKQHWKGVFKKKHVSNAALQIWMEDLFVKNAQGCFITGLPEKSDGRWNIGRGDVKNAVKTARDSMPGPDGIPSKAYKILGDEAIDILYDAIGVLGRSNSGDTIRKAYADRCVEDSHDFNASLLCCLPKKPHGVDPEAGEYYAGEDTRPLALVNVENRIIASAARLCWEPILAKFISKNQQGFLKGRQMLNNVIDIDYEAMTVSIKHDKGALLFFDFKAAFPSIAHNYLFDSLRAIGLPRHAINFIKSLYDNNACKIAYKGAIYEGFGMECGVRQGCPISPLLFAASVDILLRMLTKKLPKATFKAFADDIGAVITDWDTDSPVAEQIFSEFAIMSGLDLNIKKTVCIPLWLDGKRELEQTLRGSERTWKDVSITGAGTYLGFVEGPERGNKTYDKPAHKFIKRCCQWGGMGAGLQYTTVAFNTFAASTLAFVAQLDSPTEEVIEAEKSGVRKCLPGPGNWYRVYHDPYFLKEVYGQQHSFRGIRYVSQAAQLRVTWKHDCYTKKHREQNILSIEEMSNRIGSAGANLYDDRTFQWAKWYASSHAKQLHNNRLELERKGISIESVLVEIAGHTSTREHPCILKIE